MKTLSSLFAAALLLVSSAGLQAAVIVDYNGGAQTDETHFDGQISATDLVNAGQPTLASVDATAVSGGSIAGLNDGTAVSSSSTTWAWYGSGTITFNLNTTLNPQGYDITKINSFAGWGANMGAQSFELSLKTTSSGSSFVSYGTFSNTSGFTALTTSTSLSTLTTLTGDSGGTIATGVTALQFWYTIPGVPSPNGTVIREIDVVGAATAVPEPSTWAMMVVGFGALAGMQRLRRRSNA